MKYGAAVLIPLGIALVAFGVAEMLGVSPIGRWTLKVFGGLLVVLGALAILAAAVRFSRGRTVPR